MRSLSIAAFWLAMTPLARAQEEVLLDPLRSAPETVLRVRGSEAAAGMDDEFLYWTDGGRLLRRPIDGGKTANITRTPDETFDSLVSPLTVHRGDVYGVTFSWSESRRLIGILSDGTMRNLPGDAGSVAIAVHGDSLFRCIDRGARIIEISIGRDASETSPRQLVRSGAKPAAPREDCTRIWADADSVLWLSGNALYRVARGGGAAELVAEAVSGFDVSGGII